MLALTRNQWLQLALVWAAISLISACRMVLWARRTGRSTVTWFFITLFFTAIPAAVASLCDRFGWLFSRDSRGDQPAHYALSRCPHCRRLLDPPGTAADGGPETCSHCGMLIDEDTLA